MLRILPIGIGSPPGGGGASKVALVRSEGNAAKARADANAERGIGDGRQIGATFAIDPDGVETWTRSPRTKGRRTGR